MNPRFRFQHGPDLRALSSSHASQGIVTEGLFDSNVETDAAGDVRVALWREWRPMLIDLQDVGQVWSVVRNGHCVLAVQGNYPELIFASDPQSATARHGDSALACHFRAWRQAAAFDSGCCCGRVYGVEIENALGQIFHRICLTKGTELGPFTEWIQMHQATGLEEEEETLPVDQGQFHPQSFRRAPGTLEVPVNRLRSVLIHAAQREIPLIAGVASEGITQMARIDIRRASETHGQLVLSGDKRSLYVASEPTGTLLAEPATLGGESMWTLSLADANDHRLLHLQSGIDGRVAWNQLIREFVFCSTTSEPMA